MAKTLTVVHAAKRRTLGDSWLPPRTKDVTKLVVTVEDDLYCTTFDGQTYRECSLGRLLNDIFDWNSIEIISTTYA